MLRFSLVLLVLLVLLVGNLGCGSSQRAGSSTVAEEAVAVAIPERPVELIPAGAEQLLTTGPSLRSAANFPTWIGWLERVTCVRTADAPWLLERTERLAFANFPPDAEVTGTENLLVLRGSYTDADTTLALGQLADWAAIGTRAATRGEHRGFATVTAAPLTATRLDDHTLMVGDTRQVHAAIALVHGEGQRFIDGGLMGGSQLDVDALGIAVVATPSGPARAVVANRLRRLGAGKLAKHGDAVQWVSLGLNLQDGLGLRLSIGTGDEQTASQIVRQGMRLVSQGDLFLRLAGLPAIGERAETSASGEGVAQLSLSLSDGELKLLSERLGAMVGTFDAASCGPPVAASGPDA